MNIDDTVNEQPRVASVKLRLKSLKDPKLEIYHNSLEDRIVSMDNINKTIDIYEERTGFQWTGTSFVFVMWDEENPHNAAFTCETTGLDHPEMVGDYVKTIIQTTKREEF